MAMVKKTATKSETANKKPASAKTAKTGGTTAPELGAASPPPALLGGGRALEHGRQAAGASEVREGFAFTPEMDFAFALGWPHLASLSDDHPDDADPEKAARARLTYEHVWPRGVATRWCRLTAVKGFRRAVDFKIVLNDKGEAAVVRGEPIDAVEARAMLVDQLTSDRYVEDLFALPFLLEAMVGPDAVAEALVAAVEAAPDARWDAKDQHRAGMVQQLGFVLLRARPAVVADLRVRLEAVFERRTQGTLAKNRGESGVLIRAVDLVLHGKAGAERSALRVDDAIDPSDVTFVLDDPAFVRQTIEKQATSWLPRPDPRHVFLGGEALLGWYLANLKKLKSYHEEMAEQLAPIRGDATRALMTALAKTVGGKAAAKRWLAEHPS